MEIILIRHAEPETAGTYIGRGSDPGLSAEGTLAARKLAGALAAEKPGLLFSSPLKRATATIDPASRLLKRPFEQTPGLAEIDFGEWEGLDWKAIQSRYPGRYSQWLENPWNTAPPGGETLRELSDRVISTLSGIAAGNGDQRILIVCHAGPIRTVLAHALNLKPEAFWNTRIDYTGLCRFSRKTSGEMNLLQWNVTRA